MLERQYQAAIEADLDQPKELLDWRVGHNAVGIFLSVSARHFGLNTLIRLSPPNPQPN